MLLLTCKYHTYTFQAANRHSTSSTQRTQINPSHVDKTNVNMVVSYLLNNNKTNTGLCQLHLLFSSVLFASNVINVNTYQYQRLYQYHCYSYLQRMRLNHGYMNVPSSSPPLLLQRILGLHVVLVI